MKEIESNQQNLKNVSFGIYHPSEIKKLSVIEIINPEIFINPETHEKPLPYGLYDPHLGPIDETTCETCGLSGKFCPGHFGHITLPLPVFNPVLLKSLYQLLQATCFNCHKLLADALDVHLLLCQLEALDYGQVSLAIKFSKIPKQFKFEKRRKSLDDFNRDLEHVMDEAIPGLNLLYESRGQIKSVVECRQQVINDFWNILTKNGKKKCLHCDKTNLKIAKNAEDICTKRHFIFYETERNENSSFNSMDSFSEDTVNVNLTPLVLRLHLNEVWENESTVLEHLFGCLSPTWTSSDYPMDVFFIGMLMVPPSRFRPAVIIEDQTFLNPQSLTLKNVVHDVAFLKHLQDSLNGKPIADTIKKKFYSIPGKTNGDKFNNMWHQLQTHVNFVYSGETNTFSKEVTAKGIKQMLEKKEGLIQEHMMGKRVNFAARTVITPNPYIGVDEIGVPEMFAKTLTYRTSVTNFNALKLKAAVINGADFHPGANKIEKDGGKVINLGSMDPYVRRTNAHWLSKNYSSQSTCKKNPIKIHRHLKDGDVVLLNRQPTLHKPSIMAHKVKVLPGAGKTFQLHYANCKAYNADFDGDEMNLHFPQSECGRSEASNILNVSNQYLVPKDGTPLSGLIQDHIVAGVLLSMRGRFFTRDEYQQLVYDAVAFLKKPIKTLPPAILKPCALWSGKQVISTIIIIVTPDGLPPPTLDGKAHISSKNWQKVAAREWRAGGTPLLSDDMSESQVIIRSGELLCGVIDKAHVGPTPYGLVHCCYELYGGVISTALLTALTRLFTNFLQTHSGFTLSIDDICLTKKANKSRRKVMNSTHKNVKDVVADVFGVDNPENESEVKARFKEAHMTEDDVILKALHFGMKRAVNIYNDQKNGICMSEPMKKFPDNNFQLMVQAGSKGSVVNALQISSGLGQVELEGQRVPLMLNGNTLPSYLPYNTSFEAGGFVDGRFLTGLYPQEFFFHCLAGREGLVDTAVKTSGSGHLYNSLVKHLEGLMVNYDLTVRDADGSVIQFLYGEDGLDVTKVQMLQKDKLHFLAKNYVAAKNETEIKILKARQAQPSFLEEVKAINRSLEPDINLQNENTVYQGIMSSVLGNDLCNLCFYVKESEQKANLDRGNFRLRPDLIFGYVSKQVAKIIEDYINTNYVKKMGPGDQNMETFTAAVNLLSLYYHRALRAVAPPGEAVGLLAAQSIGEPATQMTLNTFHFAGRNEMNVTLGMPRLREILMYASENIKTPIMDLPLLEKSGVEKEAEKLCLKLSKVYLKQVLRSIEIQESLHVEVRSQSFRKYTVKMTFLPVDEYKDILFTTPARILKFVESYFIEHVIKISKNSILDKTRKYSPKKSAAIEHSDVEEFDESVSDDDGVDCAAPMEAHGKMGKGFSKDLSTPNKFAFKDDQLHEAVERRKSRENSVVNKDSWIKTYEFDARYQRWCKFELQIPLEEKKIDIKTIVEDEANNAVLHEVPNVEKAFLLENPKSKKKEKMLKTDGINIHEVFRHHHIIDVNKIYSNDIHAMKNIYGIEAATKVIVKEVANVFATYGIRVDPRHLLLIADYMTCEGTVKAFNHYGFQTNASPLQKMSFATAMDFLENAIVSVMITFVAGRKETQKDPQHFENHCSLFQANDREGEKEDLKSPSAKIIVGQPVTIGTGCFELLQKPEAARSTKARSGKIKFLL